MMYTYTVQNIWKITILNVFERSLLCSSSLYLAYLSKNTEKMWNIITIWNNDFLFYYTLKYISVMQNWFFISHYSSLQYHMNLHKSF